jgi:hypothetical protein
VANASDHKVARKSADADEQHHPFMVLCLLVFGLIALAKFMRRQELSGAYFLPTPPGPEQDCKNDQPNDAPADPCDVRVGRLPPEQANWPGTAIDSARRVSKAT